MNADVHFHRLIEEGAESTTDARFRSSTEITLMDHEIDEQLQHAEDYLNELAEDFTSMGSGWLIQHVGEMTLGFASYHPIAASSYIPTPDFIVHKHATVNIQNLDDDRCFLYCVIAHELDIQQHPHRVNHYRPYESCFNMKGIHYPLSIQQIPKFDSQNPRYSIGVLSYVEDGEGNKTLAPMYMSKHQNRPCHVNMLLLTGQNQKGETLRHYILIKNLGRLLYHTTEHTVYPCRYCLHRFSSEERCKRHSLDCGKNDPVAITFPQAKSVNPSEAEL